MLNEKAQMSWLERKANENGFRVLGCRLGNRRAWRWVRKGERGVHDGVDFEGALEVVDAGRLGNALLNGIGRGKTFGFGLLSLARLDR